MSLSLLELQNLLLSFPHRSMRDRFTGVEGEFLRAAFECIAEEGIAATSTYRIAARAGTYQGRLRHYYPSKEILFQQLLELMYGANEQLLDNFASSSHSPAVKLALICEGGVRWITKTPDECIVFVAYSAYAMAVGGTLLERSWHLRDNFLDAIARVVSEGERLGTFARGSSRTAPQMILSLHWGFALDYALKPDPHKIGLIRSSLLAGAAAAVGRSDLLSS